MKKSTKVTITIALLGCIIGTLAGRVIIERPYFDATEIMVEQESAIENIEKPSAESFGMTIEDKETILNDDLQSQLDAAQSEMNDATSDYIKQQEEAREATLKAEEAAKKEAEAKKKTEEEAKKAEEVEKKETSGESASNSGESGGNSNGNNNNSGTFMPENDSGDVIEGMDDDYYDDYSEEQNVETTPSATEQPRISLESLGSDIITGTIDFGDPNAPEHQNDWENYMPPIDMSNWDVTIH